MGFTNWAIASAIAAAAIFTLAPRASAEPVEYVKICSAQGKGYYYVPGTRTCVNADTGVTKRITANGTVTGETTQSAKASEGSAMAIALPSAIIDPGKNFAFAGNIATFGGQSAVGFSAAARVSDGLSLTGGIGFGLGEHTVGGRAGFNVSW